MKDEISLISIIIPYFNRPEKLERCLNSIFSQKYTNYEIIVVDDCSTIPCKIKHQNVTYLKNKLNSGPGVSRNLGIKHAKGVFITFLDCDDFWHKDFLNKLTPILFNNPQACMVYSNGVKIDEDCNIIGSRRKKTLYPTSILPNVLYNGRHWGTGACVWRVASISHTQFLESRSWEDYAFDVSVGIKNNIVIPVKEVLVYYDVSGEDKLSKKNEAEIIVEKHKSIIAISKLLLLHDYKKDLIINKSVTVLILLNTIKLLRLEIKNNLYLIENLKNIRKWKNFRFYCYMLILVKMPRRHGIMYLKKLRLKVDQEYLIQINKQK